MFSITKNHLLTALLSVSALLAACGGGGSPGGSSTPPVTPPVTTNYMLTVTAPSNGTITTNTGGISCGTTCSASYAANTVVTLTAAPALNYSFSSWGGACSGNANTCDVTLSQARTVSASFTASSTNNGTAVLSWTAPTQDTDGNAIVGLSGYRIYYGTSASALNQTASVSGGMTLTHTIGSLTAGTWHFAITSVTGTGASAVESDRTGTVSKVIP